MILEEAGSRRSREAEGKAKRRPAMGKNAMHLWRTHCRWRLSVVGGVDIF